MADDMTPDELAAAYYGQSATTGPEAPPQPDRHEQQLRKIQRELRQREKDARRAMAEAAEREHRRAEQARIEQEHQAYLAQIQADSDLAARQYQYDMALEAERHRQSMDQIRAAQALAGDSTSRGEQQGFWVGLLAGAVLVGGVFLVRDWWRARAQRR